MPARPHRLVYLGTPDAAVAPLRALVDAGFDIALVVSRPDRRRGRGGATSPSPVKAAALELGLAVTERVDEAAEVDADLGVVVAYGRLIMPPLLAVVPMVNLHFSLLPRWRGAAPVERALLAGDDETGVCLMQLEAGLDTGPVFARRVVPIPAGVTADELRRELVVVGAALLVECLTGGLGRPEPQVGDVTLAAKVDRSELELRWERHAADLDRVVRLGRAWTTFRGRRLRVLRAELLTPDGEVDGPGDEPGTLGGEDGLQVATGAGTLRLRTVQPEGKTPQPAEAWRNGARPTPGERLGS